MTHEKAKVECGVLVVERWILACLRNRTFFSLAELNSGADRVDSKLGTRHPGPDRRGRFFVASNDKARRRSERLLQR